MLSARPSRPRTDDPRLTFTPRPAGPGQVDGRWWPRSDDLAAELPALLAAVAHRVDPVDRISLDPETWACHTGTVTVGDRVILLDWFGTHHRRTIALRGPHPSHVELLVIPFDTAPVVALACLTMPAPGAAPAREQESHGGAPPRRGEDRRG